LSQIWWGRQVFIEYLKKDAKRGHNGSSDKFLKGRFVTTDEGECSELPWSNARDQIGHVQHIFGKFAGILREVAENHKD
jgi:hypothetical protein